MNRRTIFPILGAVAAAPFIGLPKLKARPKHFSRIWKGQRKLWLSYGGGFDNPRNWEPYGVPRRSDTIVVKGGELRIPAGRKFKRLEVHEGLVMVDNDLCGNHCCFDEIIVYDTPGKPSRIVGEGCSEIEVK